MTFSVKENQEGMLLREFLKEECAVSHNLLVKLKKLPDGILLNGERVTVRAVIHSGDTVTVKAEDSALSVNPLVVPEGEMPEILFEDEALLVVNKPGGMPTHTSHGHTLDSLANRVCAYYEKNGIPFVFRAINRLDKDTSGVVLIAKNAFYAAKLSKAQRSGDFEKKYLAVLDGETLKSGKIEGYIKREEKSIIKRSFSLFPSDGADYSLTEYKTVETKNGVSLAEIEIKTGRTHQIRVSFASLGTPVLGDTLYGRESTLIDRQALHSVSLSFTSPLSGERQTVSAPLPKDMRDVIARCEIDIADF